LKYLNDLLSLVQFLFYQVSSKFSKDVSSHLNGKHTIYINIKANHLF